MPGSLDRASLAPWPAVVIAVVTVMFLILPLTVAALILIGLGPHAGVAARPPAVALPRLAPPPGLIGPTFRRPELWQTGHPWLRLAAALGATAISLGLGIPSALSLVRRPLPGARTPTSPLLRLLIGPLVVGSVGCALLVGQISPNQGVTGQIATHAFASLPLVILILVATLRSRGEPLECVAASLGASPLEVFRRVTLPSIAVGVLASALLVFATSLRM
jgi:putative spermidine/putrescine transport system permease protein